MMRTSSNPYPPKLSEQQLSNLIFNIKDYQITHGMLLKYGPDANSINAVPIGVSLFPTLFPEALFEEARELQVVYNKLYAQAANDDDWLFEALEDLIQTDEFTNTLWRIYAEAKQEGYVQDITLGLFRSDYMVHVSSDEASSHPMLTLKQVEFNTYSIAGGTHANNAANMHEHLNKTGGGICLPPSSNQDKASATPRLPKNQTIASLVCGLVAAHEAYGPPKSRQASKTGILFIVQPRNMNICDERPLEYALWNHDPPIPAYRVIFGEDVLACTSITDSRELLYQPPSGAPPIEVSVAYMRAGYDPEEYTPTGYACRLHLEISRAIKCPSILGHLATFKKVQQALAAPGALQRFLSLKEAEQIAKTFVPMHPLNASSKVGRRGRALACDPQTASNYVLKPSLEGGGHNIYRDAIPAYLKSIPQSRWQTYILMELVNPVTQPNILLSPRGTYTAEDAESAIPATSHPGRQHTPAPLTQQKNSHRRAGPTLSELGIFGICLWKCTSPHHNGNGNSNSDPAVIPPLLLKNSEAGWSLKTKPAAVDEMSVVKGYGCFDAPWLVDEETYLASGTYVI